MKKVARNFKDDTDGGDLSGVKYAIVAANNHNAGFAPRTVIIFRQLLGLDEVKRGDGFIGTDDLEKEEDVDASRRAIKTKQTSLSDFWR